MQVCDCLPGAVLRVFRAAATKVADCRLSNTKSLGKQRLSPTTFPQRFDDVRPVHASEYIARAIVCKHRPSDLCRIGQVDDARMADQDTSTPGGRFKAARLRAGMSQVAVAAAAGVSQPAISEFEGGRTDGIQAINLVKMCVAVGVTAEYVVIGTRSAQDDQEAEAVALLRGADSTQRDLAMRALRGMLTASPAPASRKQQPPRAA